MRRRRKEKRKEGEEEGEEEGRKEGVEEGRRRGRCWERGGVIKGKRSDEIGDHIIDETIHL